MLVYNASILYIFVVVVVLTHGDGSVLLDKRWANGMNKADGKLMEARRRFVCEVLTVVRMLRKVDE